MGKRVIEVDIFLEQGVDAPFCHIINENFEPPPADPNAKQDQAEYGQRQKRRSVRTKKSRIDQVEEPDLKLSHVIVELPHYVKPGDKVLVSWPYKTSRGVPEIFLVQVPETAPILRSGRGRRRRLLQVMAPDCFIKNNKKRKLEVRKDGIHSPGKNQKHAAFKSPQKEMWRGYQKSCSRVGEEFQVPVLPSTDGFKFGDENDETMPEG
jgi:hypothetical protein